MRKRDLTGCRFGALNVIDRASDYVSPKGYHKIMWNCECDCGQTCVVMSSHLLSGHTTSCGCQKLKGLTPLVATDLTGCEFGMLKVMYRQPNRMIGANSRVVWHCRCKCGKETDVLSLLLTGGLVKSCGCLSVSHAERIMAEYLSEKGVVFDTQYHFDGLVGIGGGVLKFDFVVFRDDKVQFVIELDGEQHYRPIDYFGGIDKYNQIRANDDIKNVYCQKQGIGLIRIDVSKCQQEESFIRVYDEALLKYFL